MHAHTHDHSHGPFEPGKRVGRAFMISVSLNLLFVIVQLFYAFMANSMSLLADAGHNFGDVVGLGLAWGANWLASRQSNARYSYGYRRTTILAAIANALILVATSAIIAYESILKLLNPVQVNEIIIIVVSIIGIGINGGTALLFIKDQQKDLNIKGAFLHLLYDALINVGIVIGGIIIYFTNWLFIDPVLGLGIVVIILMGTWGLLRNSVNLLMDAVPEHIPHNEVLKYLQALPGVTEVHDLHIWGLSTKETALTAHLIIPEGGLSDSLHNKINADLAHEFQIHHITLQIESGSGDFVCEQMDSC